MLWFLPWQDTEKEFDAFFWACPWDVTGLGTAGTLQVTVIFLDVKHSAVFQKVCFYITDLDWRAWCQIYSENIVNKMIVWFVILLFVLNAGWNKKVNSLCKNEWLALCGSGLLYWCYQYLFQCILCFNINTIRFFSCYFLSCLTHKYRVSGWYSLHNHVKPEKEIYFPFSAKTQRVWCLTYSQVIF